MNRNSDSTLFNFETIEKESERSLSRSLDRIREVLIDPKRLSVLEYDGISFSKKYNDLLTLILILRYSDYFGILTEYCLIEIESYLQRNLLFPELHAICKTEKKNIPCLIFFYSKISSEREYFGNILSKNQIQKVVRRVHLRILKPRRPKRTQRRRGYKDQGSKRPDHRWLPTHDFELDRLQERIESERISYQQKSSYLSKPMRVGLPSVVSNKIKLEKEIL